MAAAGLDALLLASVSAASIEEALHWYDDGSGTVTWMEIEGEGYGWAFMQRPASEWNLMMRERVAAFVTEEKAALPSEEWLVIAQDAKQTIYHFIARKANAYDLVYVCNQEKAGMSYE